MTKSPAWVTCGLVGVLSTAGLLAGPASAASKPQLGGCLPAVTLLDLAGHRHTLAERGNHPDPLFFFCGCTPCHETARLWSQVQQNGDLKRPGSSTVIVFLGDRDSARTFAAQTGLDLSQTLILLDPTDWAGQRFGVMQCPRVFVTDARQHIAYTNPDVGDPAPRLSPISLISRTLSVWRHLPVTEKPILSKTEKPILGKKASP